MLHIHLCLLMRCIRLILTIPPTHVLQIPNCSNNSFLLWQLNVIVLILGVMTCRHHCFRSGIIHKDEGGLIYRHFLTVLRSLGYLTGTRRRICLFFGRKVFYMPLLTPSHSFKTCGAPESFSSATILRRMACNLAHKSENTTS